MRILITEDDGIGRRVLQLFLQPYGEVDIASEGNEALAKFDQAQAKGEPYDLLLLDIGLPGRGGLEVLGEIRSFESKNTGVKPLAVIMLTGNAGSAQIAAAEKLGAAKYLLKPVLESELVAHLQELSLIPAEVKA